MARIPEKLQEHYGINVPISSAQAITQKHAREVNISQKKEPLIPNIDGVEQIITEMDGTMIPIVKTTPAQDDDEIKDRRKTRELSLLKPVYHLCAFLPLKRELLEGL